MLFAFFVIIVIFVPERPSLLSYSGRYARCESLSRGGLIMPRGDKSKYTDKEKRQAEHIERGYEEHGVSEKEAERRAWATVNKVHHGGEKPGGGGYGKSEDHSPMRRGGRNSHKKR